MTEEKPEDTLRARARASRQFRNAASPNPGLLLSGDFAPDFGSREMPTGHFSWEGKDVLSRVRDQGRTNLCTSFSIVAAMEAQHRISTGSDIALAPAFIHNCLADEWDTQIGLNAKFAADACRNDGVAVADNDQIPVPDGFCTASHDRMKVRETDWVDSVSTAFSHLKDHGPIVVEMGITKEGPFFDWPGGNVFDRQPDPDNELAHCLCLVGLDFRNADAIATVQNSFGEDWGDHGFARIRVGTGGLLTHYWSVSLTV